MKRPVLFFAFSQIAGILAGSFTGSYLVCLLLALAAGFLTAALCRRKPRLLLLLAGMVLFFLMGSWGYLSAGGIHTSRFAAYSGREVVVEGSVASEPDIRDSRIQYIIAVESILLEGTSKKTGGRLLLTTVKSEPSIHYRYGQRLSIAGKLELPRKRSNPGGFDYRRYLAQ